MMDLEGKVAIVTGGASGIGRATVERLVRRGATVHLLDINESHAQKAARELGEGGRITTANVDVADDASLVRFAGSFRAQHTQLHILINCAGWDRGSEPFAEMSTELWDRIVAINMRGPMRLTQLLLPQVINARGAIVNVSSDAGRTGQGGLTVYAAAKGGLIAFTKSLAREVARQGVRVNCIAPGPVDTPLLHAAMKPTFMDAMRKLVPMRRLGNPGELADAIVFFATDASSYITGQVLSVNGGLMMYG